MTRFFFTLLIGGLAFVSCASRSGDIHDADAVAEIGWVNDSGPEPEREPEEVLDRYSVDFRIPNPLVEKGLVSNRRVDPSHESLIYCRATLLDSISTEADIALACRKDSLDVGASAEYRRKYLEEQVQPGRFRIRISMESGFSSKSLDPRHWVIYLVNSRGVMIEPAQIKSVPVSTARDSLFSSFHRISLPRTLMHGEITLYFDRVTFFKEDLLGEENPRLAMDMVHEKETVARVVWRNSAAEKMQKE